MAISLRSLSMVDSQPFAHRLGLLQTSLGKRPLLSALPQTLFFFPSTSPRVKGTLLNH